MNISYGIDAILLLIGLCLGSFINMLIYRLPLILHRQLHQHANEFLQSNTLGFNKENGLYSTFSICPNCQKNLKLWHKIPLLSFLLLKGKCNYCRTKISYQYPVIELLFAALTMIVYLKLGLSAQSVAALFFTGALLCMATIDIQHKIIPDGLTLSTLWIGLIASLFNLFIATTDAILGAIFGYLALWLFYWIYKFLTKKEAIGYGDFKLLAACGAWCGWKSLPCIIFAASFIGTIVGLLLVTLRKHEPMTPLAFAPYLAISAWVILLWPDQIFNYVIK